MTVKDKLICEHPKLFQLHCRLEKVRTLHDRVERAFAAELRKVVEKEYKLIPYRTVVLDTNTVRLVVDFEARTAESLPKVRTLQLATGKNGSWRHPSRPWVGTYTILCVLDQGENELAGMLTPVVRHKILKELDRVRPSLVSKYGGKIMIT